MTTTSIAERVSTRAVLFESQQDAIGAVTACISSGRVADNIRGALQDVPSVTKNIALGQLGAAAAKLLELDLTDILAVAWRKLKALQDAARRTAKDHNTEELPTMMSQKINLSHQPYIDLLLDGKKMITVTFQLELECKIAGVVPIINSGYLTAVRAGTCDVRGSFGVEGTNIVERSKNFDLPSILQLKNGIPLLHGPELPSLSPSSQEAT
jgi:hypothetical protein